MPEKDTNATASYWREKIEHDLGATTRSDFMENCGLADKFINNKPITKLDDEILTMAFMQNRQYALGKLAYGDMKPAVAWTQNNDEFVAKLQSKFINWEFTRPRGMKQTIGRNEVTRSLSNWFDYGLGCINVRFDYTIRDKENFTGSIITEHVPCKELILDSDVSNVQDMERISRRFKVTAAQIKSMFPSYKGEIPIEDDGDNRHCYLYEIQYLLHKPQLVKLTNDSVVESTNDFRPYWQIGDKESYISKFGKDQNKLAETLWEAMGDDYISVPMWYSMMFMGSKSEKEINHMIQEQTYVGKRSSYALITFQDLPCSPYPVGAAFYLYSPIKYARELKTLYLNQMRKIKGGGIIDADKLMAYGSDAVQRARKAKQALDNGEWEIMSAGGEKVADLFKQFDFPVPNSDMLVAAGVADKEVKDYLNTHLTQLGQPEFSGQPAELAKILQGAGTFPLVDKVDSIKRFIGGIFKRISCAGYHYIPPNKYLMLSDYPPEDTVATVTRLKDPAFDPNDMDINVELDTVSEQERQTKAMLALKLFELGVTGPRTLLEDIGERDPDKKLEESKTWTMGKRMAQVEAMNPQLFQEFNTMLDQAIQTQLLDQRQKSKNGRN